MTRYHRVLPVITEALTGMWRWLWEPSDQHTVLGRCGCVVCSTHLWEDR